VYNRQRQVKPEMAEDPSRRGLNPSASVFVPNPNAAAFVPRAMTATLAPTPVAVAPTPAVAPTQLPPVVADVPQMSTPPVLLPADPIVTNTANGQTDVKLQKNSAPPVAAVKMDTGGGDDWEAGERIEDEEDVDEEEQTTAVASKRKQKSATPASRDGPSKEHVNVIFIGHVGRWRRV
jgi:hypothetical protein